MNEEQVIDGNIRTIETREKYPLLQLNVKVSAKLNKEVIKLGSSYSEIIGIIIVNLLSNNKVSYSRTKGITIPTKYNKKKISNDRIIRAIDEMVGLGLCNNYIAKQSFNNDFIKDVSYIEATKLLIDGYASFKNVKQSKKTVIEDRQCVILKDKEGKRIDYKDNEYTNNVRKQLTDYNMFANSFNVEHDGKQLSTTLDAHYKESFTDYGRLFGASYQTLKKEDRKDILIETIPTIEIDFKNLHFRMVLDMFLLSHHVKIDDDLYTLPLSDDMRENPQNRVGIKKMFNMIINTTSKASAFKALQYEINFKGLSLGDFNNVSDVYQCLVDCYPYLFNNPSIMSHIHSGKPLSALLQRKESSITLDIITTCKQIGFLVCPIHDSYKTDSCNAYFLAKIIGDCYRKEMQTKNGVFVDVIVKDKTWQQIV